MPSTEFNRCTDILPTVRSLSAPQPLDTSLWTQAEPIQALGPVDSNADIVPAGGAPDPAAVPLGGLPPPIPPSALSLETPPSL